MMSFGAITVQAYWNASTNTPKLASGQGTNGQGYLVSVAGGTVLDGNTGWQINDLAVFLLDKWVRFTAIGATWGSLPTTPPTPGSGILWNNGGVVCIA